MNQKYLTKVQPIGSYLVEAGLITHAQLDVALNDQQVMYGMRLGEILVTRGWVKQQTLDYLIKRIIEPEQKAARRTLQQIKQAQQFAKPTGSTQPVTAQPTGSTQPATAQPKVVTQPPAASRPSSSTPQSRSQPPRSAVDDITWAG